MSLASNCDDFDTCRDFIKRSLASFLLYDCDDFDTCRECGPVSQVTKALPFLRYIFESHHHANLRMIRELIIKEQHMGSHQTKISSFFGPRRPVQDNTPASHFPSFLGTPPTPKDCTNADPCCSLSIVSSHSLITPGDDVQDADHAELMIISDSD